MTETWEFERQSNRDQTRGLLLDSVYPSRQTTCHGRRPSQGFCSNSSVQTPVLTPVVTRAVLHPSPGENTEYRSGPVIEGPRPDAL